MTKFAKVLNKISKKDYEWLSQQERINFSLVEMHDNNDKVTDVVVAIALKNDLKTYKLVFEKPCVCNIYQVLKNCNVHFRKALGFKKQGVCYFDDIDRLILKANIKGHND